MLMFPPKKEGEKTPPRMPQHGQEKVFPDRFKPEYIKN